eukprot:13774966-Alexandrium_andersonii.AAC.1
MTIKSTGCRIVPGPSAADERCGHRPPCRRALQRCRFRHCRRTAGRVAGRSVDDGSRGCHSPALVHIAL